MEKSERLPANYLAYYRLLLLSKKAHIVVQPIDTRPITIFFAVCKCIEKCLLNRYEERFWKLIYTIQVGFRPLGVTKAYIY